MYGPANNLLKNYLSKKMNIATTYVAGTSASDFENAIQPNTRVIYLESPSSAIFSLQNIAEVVALAKTHDIKTIIDNTWATPIFQKPLILGVDLELHSCSKYLGGHSDLVGGVLIGKEIDLLSIFHNEYELLGAKTAPMEAWLLLRSLRTLTIRLEKHQNNALMVASFLEQHSAVRLVNYPGLESFAQYELGKHQMTGYTGLLSFQLDTEDLVKIKQFVNSLKLFQIGVSWGGHESLVYVPAISYLKELSPDQFKKMGISLGDVRISVGLEDAEDLIDDLQNALNTFEN
jgi:cystathionine beta-lyase/cystathionine gamma-synthase